MKLNRILLATILGAQLTFTSRAADTNDTSRDADIEVLKQQLLELGQKVQALESQRAADQQVATNTTNGQIQALDQQVKVLARERELDQEAAATAAKAQPKLSVGPGGFVASSADSNFVFRLDGVVQVDSRTFFNDSANKNANDGFLLRRARPIFQGTLYRDFDFNFTPDFGGSSVQIFDAYGNYRYEPWLQVRSGKFKTPEGLEQLQQDVNISFNERSLVTDLVPNRDVGLQFWGDVNGGVLSYAAGIFNGVGDAQNSANAANGRASVLASPAPRRMALPARRTCPQPPVARCPATRRRASSSSLLTMPPRWRMANIGGFPRRVIITMAH
jgi:hypothetical protein